MTSFSIRELLLLCALLLFCGGAPAKAAVGISEFQADNRDTLADEDGEFSDWIELRNTNATVASMQGMYLTDDPLLPRKWAFPVGVAVPARGVLLVWASGKDRRVPSRNLHTNFKLESRGGYLALIAADGVTPVSEFDNYPDQPPDRSWGTSFPESTAEVVAPGAPCRWLVPVSAAVTGWQSLSFADTAWQAARTGIGFDSDAPGTDFLPFIGENGNTMAQMLNLRPVVYVRIPFTVSNASAVSQMSLAMRYDDGFAAWLNGVRLNPPAAAETNAPANPLWNSLAALERNNLLAAVQDFFDLSAQRSLLVNGTNILAIQGFNRRTTDPDLIIQPSLQLTYTDTALQGPGYFAKPNPGAVNTGVPTAGFVDAPDFSVKRGVFSAPFPLTLTSATPEAVIRYTTDGSSPLDGGTAYTGPLRIAATSVIRAAAFRDGWQTSPVKSHTFVFPADVKRQPSAPPGMPPYWGNDYNFTTGGAATRRTPADYAMDQALVNDPAYSSEMEQALGGTLPVMSIAAAGFDLFDPNDGIYSNGRLIYLIKEIPASIEYFNPLDPTGSEKWQEDAGLRIHGGDALIEHPKKPFRIYFRKDYGTDKLRYPLYPGSPVEEFNKLQLRPGGHDGWAVPFGSGPQSLAAHATYLRDRFLRQCELDMGRLVHRGRYVHLYLNGLYWGVYDLHEVIDARFFADHVGGDAADWDVVEQQASTLSTFDIVDGSTTAMDAALALVRPPQQLLDPEVLAQLQTYVPFEEFIDNLIVQMWGAQNDWLGPVFRGTPGVNLTDASRFNNKNWQAGRRSRGTLANEGFFWQTWDAEISMGNSLTNLVSVQRVADFNHTLIGTPDTDIDTQLNVANPAPAAELYNALRKHSPLFRRMFADRLQRHFFNDGALSRPRMELRLARLRKLLDMPLAAEGARWGDVNTGDPVAITFTRNTHWRSEVDWLRDTYIGTRQDTLLQQFSAIGLWNGTPAPALSSSGGSVPAGFQLHITDPSGQGTVYYTTDGSDPMELRPPQNVELLSATSPCQYFIPPLNYTGTTWKNPASPPDIASWTSGVAALGFDANTTFLPHITTTVQGMRSVRSSCLIRIPFTASGKLRARMTDLTLHLKYDDGAYVYLNGSGPILRLNAPTGAPVFTAAATASRADASAVISTPHSITSRIPLLQEENVLAIQGLNINSSDDDFLCVPRITATLEQVSRAAPSAQAAGEPLALTQSGTVKARTLINGTWSPLTEARFIVGDPAAAGNLTVSEFNYRPAPPTPAETSAGYTSGQMFEFIELLNTSQNEVQLTGCSFSAGIDFDFTADSRVQTLAPGQRLVIAASEAAFHSRHPSVPVAGVFQNATALSNGGERLTLLSAAGSPIFEFTYDDDAPWPTAADGGGFSLVLRQPSASPDLNEAENWRASLAPGGAPGAADDGDTYSAWATRQHVAGGPADDPDGNGLPSLLEYALNLPPAAPAGELLHTTIEIVPAVDTSRPCLVVRYRTAATADDVRVSLETSTGLDGWEPLTTMSAAPLYDAPTGTTLYTFHSPRPAADSPALYVRLKARLSPE